MSFRGLLDKGQRCEMLLLSYHIHETSTNKQIKQALSCANGISPPNLLTYVLSSADLSGCQQGENFIKVVNVLVFISFQNYNFKNDFPLNLAFVCVLAPTMAPFVEP